MTERFKILMEQLQLSPSAFADRIGVQRSSISHILSGRNKPSIDFLEKIMIEFPETDLNWLITGQASAKAMPFVSEIKPTNEVKTEIDQHSTENEMKKPVPHGEEPVEKIIIVYKNNSFRILYPSEI
jgi:transcriptional regulator with XRE-family HTH domain